MHAPALRRSPRFRGTRDLELPWSFSQDRLFVRPSETSLVNPSKNNGRLIRRGTTLLEVLLASVILAVGLSALTQQSFVGAASARRAELESEAAIRCTSQLNLLISQRTQLESQQAGHWEDAPDWHWESTCTPTEIPYTRRLTVRVWQMGPLENLATFTLVRLLTHAEPVSRDDQSVVWEPL